MTRIAPLFLMVLLALAASGCGSSKCQVTGLDVSPSSATLDHTMPAPGNQQQFVAFANNNGCLPPGAGTQVAVQAVWSSSDPTDVSVGTITGMPEGVATCVNAVSTPVTITATAAGSGKTLVGKSTITCK